MNPGVERYETAEGARIYRIPMQLFPELEGFAHLIITPAFVALYDVGSGFGDAGEQLDAGLRQVRDQFGEHVDWEDISCVLLSHGHIDHFGGLPFVRSRCQAPVYIHALDRRVLTRYEERLALVARRLRAFLMEAGVPGEEAEGIMALYMLNKGLFTSQEVDGTYEDLPSEVRARLRFLHVPGHCPGQVVVLVDDILLSADHVLEHTSPHQSPERLSLYTGLGHYFESLSRLQVFASKVRLTLGGHEGPIHDLDRHIHSLFAMHGERMRDILGMAEQPLTIYEIAGRLFPITEGYHRLLALEEAAAHVEFLYLHGFLRIENLADLERDDARPLEYTRTEVPGTPLEAFAQLAGVPCREPSRTVD